MIGMNRAAIAIIVLIAVVAGAAVWLLNRDTGDDVASPTTTSTVVAGTPTTTTSPTENSTAPESTTTTETIGAYTPVFEDARCEFDPIPDREPRCGFLIVPENRTDPEGNQVRLHVAWFESDNAGAPADPVVYLDGGPGGESLSTLQFGFEDQWGGFLAERDLILFDQRGVGFSEPSLECGEARDYLLDVIDENISVEDYLAGEQASYLECHDRLIGQGIDLAQYNTVTNAADVGDLRLALGIDEWNVLGISYGTRLAQGVMRDRPDGIRSVILDSAYPPDVDLFTELPANYDRALDELFAGCAADAECAAAYPNLEQRLFTLADELEADPIATSVRDITTLERYDAIIDGEALLGLVFQGLYSAEIIPVLPQLVSDLEGGDATLASLLLTNRVAQTAFVSDGMYLSVQCNEEVPFSSVAEAEAAAAAYPDLALFFAGNYGFYENCELWGSGEAGTAENEAITSDLPTLVMAGEYDPITPPAWGERAVAGLSNGTFVLFPGVGHAASLSADCPLGVALAFFADPTGPLDTSCVESMTPPDFATGEIEAAEIVLIPFEEDVFGVTVSGVVPEGWERVGPGAWARGTNVADQTAIVQQAVPGAGDPELLIGLFASQLGFADDPQPNGTYDGGGRTWTLYVGTIDGFPTEVALGAGDGVTGIVVLVTPAEERDALRSSVLLPVLDAFRAN